MKVPLLNIGQLFSMSRDAVVCTKDEAIVYMNPAAVALFDTDLTGQPLRLLLPDVLLTVQDVPYSASAVIRGKDLIVTCGAYQDLNLYSFICQNAPVPQSGDHTATYTVRNLINSIKVSAQMIMSLTENATDERLTKYAAMLNHSTYKLQHLVSSHGLISAYTDGTQVFNPVTVCLSDMCREIITAVSDLIQDHGITIAYIGDDGLYAGVDVSLFQHMLLNLICNSLCSITDSGNIHIGLKSSGKFLTLTVTTTGADMPPEKLPELFQYSKPVTPRIETQNDGLGLVAANAVAKLHGGVIIVSSIPGEGTTVAVQIRRNTERSLMAPKVDYTSSLTDLIMTELSPWLSWEDYTPSIND